MSKRILVSGANGFIASHAIEQMLAKGYEIVGTVRNPTDSAKTAHLTALPGAQTHLALVAADLNDADPFTAHADVDAILHMASPYSLNARDPQRDLIDPAVNGTISMLKAAKQNPRVKRVVLTSSMAAIADEPDKRILTEADWNTKSSLTRNPYYYSKTLAERAAHDFMQRERPNFDLVVINPFLVIGPSHTAQVTSNRIIADIIKGRYPVIMALNWGFVDVRDVAEAHIAAMDQGSASGRYICAAGNKDMARVVKVIYNNGYAKAKLPRLKLTGAIGTALMKLASFGQPAGAGSYLRSHLGRVARFNNSKIRGELGIWFRDPEDSLKDALVDLARWGHIPAPGEIIEEVIKEE